MDILNSKRYMLALIGVLLVIIASNTNLKVPSEVYTILEITIGTGAIVGFSKHFRKK